MTGPRSLPARLVAVLVDVAVRVGVDVGARFVDGLMRFGGALVAVLVVGVFAAGATGCCDLGLGECSAALSKNGGGPEPGHDFANVIASPGCDPSTIQDVDRQTHEVCAVCTGQNICGTADTAHCEQRENAAGASCSFCATADGQVLYDDCYSADPVPTADCQASPAPQGSTVGSADSVCQTCTDKNGVVVSTTCEPASDECHQENGCRVCTKASVVVVKDCPAPSITPRECEVYGNDAGRCVDCFDANDQLLSHDCTLSSQTFVACTQTTTQDGLVCTTCTDADGAIVDHTCAPQQPVLEQCTELTYSDQSCIVCVDAAGNPTAYECTPSDPAGVAAPCAFTYGANGGLCQTCGSETACVVDTNLLCEDDADPTTGGACLTCKDKSSGAVVYQRCDGQAPPPPACADTTNAAGAQCQVCSDQQTKDAVYATCGAQTCFQAGTFPLLKADGSPFVLDNANAVATCSQCQAASENAVCALRSDCGVDLTNPVAWCSTTVVFSLSPKACGNPWGDTQAGSTDELVKLLTYALDNNVAPVGVDEAGTPSTTPNTTCTTARGDRIDLAVRAADAQAISSVFADVLLHCASDADCPTGGGCRVDGSCTVP